MGTVEFLRTLYMVFAGLTPHWIMLLKSSDGVQYMASTELLGYKAKITSYKRFVMKLPNNIVRMNIFGTFDLSNPSQWNYIIIWLDRPSPEKWLANGLKESSVDLLNVL